MTYQQIKDEFLQGTISQDEAEQLMLSLGNTATSQAELTDWYALLNVTPTQRNAGPRQGFVLNPQVPPVPMGTLSADARPANVALEGKTDPLTAYLSRLGIGSKQNYNPAESYQASLFDPYKG